MAGLLAGAGRATAEEQGGAAGPTASADKVDHEEMRHLIRDGLQLLQSGQPRQAIDSDFDKIIAAYEAAYKDGKVQVYSIANPAEALAYMAMAAKDGKHAVALDDTWAYALYFKGYALVEMSDLAGGEAVLQQAQALAPFNPQIMMERANIHKLRKEWPQAMELYQAAAGFASGFARPGLEADMEAKASHGIAYIDSETGKLDEAEAIYKKCLEKNPQDGYAKNELQFIAGQRAKQARQAQ
ncbi:diguanylate cyclase/phosphodiesterase [Nitrospirillum viridazoti Y2]|nr:tetratricopeptide repeat protein [Nitrospirillum amazonense]EGY01347.1 diguanylate cyclase/phosphodiesterase [Nitrospirillum amazonense Y2]